MKTKRKRKDLSRRRQDLAQKLKLWEAKLQQVTAGWRAGTPGEAGKADFCRKHIEKLRKDLRKLSTKQRAWASSGFIY